MVILETVMIVIGLGAIIMSYRITGSKEQKQQEQTTQAAASEPGEYTVHEKEIIEKLNGYQEKMLAEASEQLSRMSNDKRMGMNEYSEEVLQRISKNHEEVVFLYDMLKEKEEDIKDLVHHVDSVKALIHDETAKEYQKMMEALELLRQSSVSLGEEIASPSGTAGEKDNGISAVETGLEMTQAGKLAQNAGGKAGEASEKISLDAENSSNHNSEIINLYKEGHSVLEISKMLSLGQGEVKFLIDLYENE